MRAFADALDSIPMSLAENSGLSPIETLASIKSRQVKEKNSRLGVDCMQTGSNGMFDVSTESGVICALVPSQYACISGYHLTLAFLAFGRQCKNIVANQIGSPRHERALRH